jgi:serpin B
MRKKQILIILLIVVVSSAILTAQVNMSNSLLSFDIFQEFAKENDDLVYSPLSVEFAVSMYSLQYANEEVFGLTSDVHDKNKNIIEYSESLSGITLNLGNGLWVRENTYDVSSDYKNDLRKFYSSEFDYFENNDDGARKINHWVADKTENLIQNLIKPDEVEDQVIVNTLYLNAPWKYSFDPEDTYNGTFYGKSGEKEVCYMKQKGDFLYNYVKDKMQIIELPYKNEDTVMIILLPDIEEGYTHEDLMQEFDATNFNAWYNELGSRGPGMTLEEVTVRLPKFKIESRLDVKEKLQKVLGRELNVESIVQQAIIIVSEEGTEAAAATYIGSKGFGGITFDASHPFSFVIYDKKIGEILFMGSKF